MELEKIRQQLLAAGYDVTRLKRELEQKERQFVYLQGVFDTLTAPKAVPVPPPDSNAGVKDDDIV